VPEPELVEVGVFDEELSLVVVEEPVLEAEEEEEAVLLAETFVLVDGFAEAAPHQLVFWLSTLDRAESLGQLL